MYNHLKNKISMFNIYELWFGCRNSTNVQ